jgi:hypothetical protein
LTIVYILGRIFILFFGILLLFGATKVTRFSFNRYSSNDLRSITPVATEVHVILRSFVLLTWMRDLIELDSHVTLWNDTKEICEDDLNSFSRHLH